MSWRSISISIRVALLTVALALMPRIAVAQGVSAEVSVTASGGYARIVFLFSEATDANVRLSNGILVIGFNKQIEVNVDRLSTNSEYISAARRDPDGKGVRLALSQKVRLNSMVAGERLFVDLLPESWTAGPPPLPREVVEDLARRTREAEKRTQQNKAINKQRPQTASRVRVSRQPTFTRYIFELSEFVAVNADRGKDELKLVFDGAIRFDLADARLMQPPMVSAIDAKTNESSTMVTLSLIGRVDVRSFREDNNFVVDIVMPEGVPKQEESRLPPLIPPAEVAPAVSAEAAPMPGLPALKSELPKTAAPAQAPVAEIAPIQAAPAQKVAAAASAPEPVVAPVPPPIEAIPVPQTQPESPPTKPLAMPAKEAAVVPASAPPASAEPTAANASIADPVTLKRQADSVSMVFPFVAPTPAAAFVRADTLWLIFDTEAPIQLPSAKSDVIREATAARQDGMQVVRIKLERPRLVSFSAEDNNWAVNIGDSIINPPQPIGVVRNVINEMRPSANIPFDDPRSLHRIADPEIGDTLLVVTGLGPARGVAKVQDFVDFRALASIQGIVIAPVADDVNVELASDRVLIARPGGLTLTSSSPSARRGSALRPSMFDSQQWGFDRQADFLPRKVSLINAASQAPENRRTLSRLELARFYFARDMYAEAKGVLDVTLSEDQPSSDDTIPLVMRGVANILMGRPDVGLKDINSPVVGMQNDASLWRAVASAKQGKWPDAREGFRKAEVTIGMLPLELQREINKEAMQASIEVGDFAGAANKLDEFQTLSVPEDMQPALSVLAGRIHEGLGRNADALEAYRLAAASRDRSSAAQGKLREIALRYRLGDLQRTDVITELEALTTAWRGDETEVETLQLLGRLYTEEGRYRDAFNVMRTAIQVKPDSDLTHSIQDDAAATFTELYLGAKGENMPAIEALSLFYDFRELTPIGRRGDEMIRRLADRLVSVDLLDQAAEVLQHQVDHRLQGAARAQVATRLAIIYLMNRKPNRAIAALKSTRTSELPNEIRNQRLLIEARALSDIGRHNLAIEVIENVDTPDAARTRADLLWAAKRFRESAEQIEMLYADRARDWAELNDAERRDILRAAVGYNLGDDKIGLGRFKEKFAPGMMQSPDRHAFEVVTSPMTASTDEFNAIARSIAAVDTLGQFLRDIRSGQEASVSPSASSTKPVSQTRLSRPDFSPTGAVAKAIAVPVASR